MPLVSASGTTSGVGELLQLDPIVIHLASGMLSGTGGVTAGVGVFYLFSGFAQGHGDLLDPFTHIAAGTASGMGSFAGGPPLLVKFARGRASGKGTFGLSGYPLPMRGFGEIRAFGDVSSVRILCPCASSSQSFRWGESVGSDGLTLCLKDTAGNRITPFLIWYTLYRFEGGWEMQVGPDRRTPIMADVGEFYAPVSFGDEGQPGNWCIVWSWLYNAHSQSETYRHCFKVLDAVAARDPNDTTPRCIKYGWFD
jgi:hypothetical protein